MKDAFLNVEQLARRHSKSKWTIYQDVSEGRLPFVKLSGSRRLLFPLAGIEQLESGDRGPSDLELVALPGGGRLCRFRDDGSTDPASPSTTTLRP